MSRMLTVLALALVVSGAARAQSAKIVPTQGKVVAIVQTDAGSYVETTRGTFVITEDSQCEEQICLTAGVIRGLPQRAPKGALPDGFVATAASGDIRKAWYGRPTDRYKHGVLGDAIEGGALVVEMSDGSKSEYVLPENQVFEDITPRIHDLDLDGTNEVVTIRASQTGGAAVVVYELNDGDLVEVAASAENGQRNRWLNIVGILPQVRDSKSSIYFIRTPHINGRLNRLDVGKSGSKDVDLKQNNFSNHVIGSRELALGLLDLRKKPRMFIPSQSRQKLRQVFDPKSETLLPGKTSHALIALENSLITATETGELVVIAE